MRKSRVSPSDRRPKGGADERGFTVVELMVTAALAAMLFTAFAYALGGGLRTLAVARGRDQANAIATQGMEDLQRFAYSSLVLCPGSPATGWPTSTSSGGTTVPYVPAGGNVPNGFAGLATVTAASCTSPILSQPCAALGSTLTAYPVPYANYTCTRFNKSYLVSRYISWSDSTDTIKRLAVVIDWTDAVGHHEVTQQSSVRAPDQNSIIGQLPPTVTSVQVNPAKAWVVQPTYDPVTGTLVNGTVAGQLVNALGTSAQPLTLSVVTQGLKTTDQVIAYFTTETPASDSSSTPSQTTSNISLTSADGNNWSGTIPGMGSGAPTFASAGGSQYISVTAIRLSDGKSNSTITSGSVITFCNNPSVANTTSSCSQGAVPVISGVTVSPASAALNPDGTLVSGTSITITATTSNLDATNTGTDNVSAHLQTVAGSSPVLMQPSLTCNLTATPTACGTWTATITPANGFRFTGGSQPVYVTADQQLEAPYSTAVAQVTPPVSFQ